MVGKRGYQRLLQARFIMVTANWRTGLLHPAMTLAGSIASYGSPQSARCWDERFGVAPLSGSTRGWARADAGVAAPTTQAALTSADQAAETAVCNGRASGCEPKAVASL
jgi:hypothetical protein